MTARASDVAGPALRALAPTLVPSLALMLVACGGVSSTLRKDVAGPHTLAVLPVAGSAPPAARELARGLLTARLQEHGFVLAEDAWVDRVLTEHGWLADPESFSPKELPAEGLAAALGVDGVLVVDGLSESRWNIFILRHHGVSGELHIVARDDRPWWTAAHSVGSTGGFLLQSGQLLTELRAQGMHGASAATIALVDALVQDVVATLPVDTDRDHHMAAAAPQAVDLALRSEAGSQPGTVRLSVVASAPDSAALRCDFGGPLRSVPMSGHDGSYSAAVEVPADAVPAALAVRARSAFGAESQREVQR